MILVYHSRNFRDSSAFGLGSGDIFTKEDALRSFNIPMLTGEKDDSGYQFVASVATNDLGDAYMLTNHIEESWTKNEDVDVPRYVDPRSSSIGDIFVTETEIFIVARVGFEKLADLTPEAAVRNARQHHVRAITWSPACTN